MGLQVGTLEEAIHPEPLSLLHFEQSESSNPREENKQNTKTRPFLQSMERLHLVQEVSNPVID